VKTCSRPPRSSSKDEKDLPNIAKSLALRHQNGEQKRDYDGLFLDFIFWWLLAAIEVTNAVLAVNPAGTDWDRDRRALRTPRPCERSRTRPKTDTRELAAELPLSEKNPLPHSRCPAFAASEEAEATSRGCALTWTNWSALPRSQYRGPLRGRRLMQRAARSLSEFELLQSNAPG
jgi:hypothetical protein